MKNALFLETADRIGRRIAGQALWDEDACTWHIVAPDVLAADGDRLASGTLYQGTAGIALFLGELYRLTGDETYRHVAQGALRHALAHAEALPSDKIGFFDGRVGIVYAAARLAVLLHRPTYRQQAQAMLTPFRNRDQQDKARDVIGGAAGVIPALLDLADILNDDTLIEQAAWLGDQLIQAAQQGPWGWSWRTLSFPSVRHLTGLAHGASGFAVALLELYRATGAERWHYAAEQAFLYERHCYNEQAANWPDYRYLELGSYYYSGRFDTLRARLEEGSVPAYTPRYVNAWCYGAPGIGLARLRAFELLGHDVYEQEARAAIRTTLASLDEPEQTFSLCHGLAGNCEALLYATDLFDEPDLRRQAEAIGRHGWATYEQTGTPWPCGTMDGATDPSLMLGEAGIGYFYLRLYDPETPSLLLLRPSTAAPDTTPDLDAYTSLQQAYIDAYFGETLRVMEAQQSVSQSQIATVPFEVGRQESDVSVVYQRLCETIAVQDEASRNLLEDAFLPERLRYEMTLDLTDYSEEFIEAVLRISPEELAWADVTVALSPATRLVQSQWDWKGWLDQDERPPTPSPDAVSFLLYRQHNQIHRRMVSPLAALVFHTAETPTPLPDLLTRILDAMAGPDPTARRTLQRQTLALVRQAYQLGIIRCTPQPALVSPS